MRPFEDGIISSGSKGNPHSPLDVNDVAQPNVIRATAPASGISIPLAVSPELDSPSSDMLSLSTELASALTFVVLVFLDWIERRTFIHVEYSSIGEGPLLYLIVRLEHNEGNMDQWLFWSVMQVFSGIAGPISPHDWQG